jgi:hypothetical protein
VIDLESATQRQFTVLFFSEDMAFA